MLPLLPSKAWLRGLVLAAILPAAAARAADFTVAPGGSDSNPGTPARPFASLERARDAVRRLKAAGHEGDITVDIRGGVYRLSRTVVFGLRDSGGPGCTIRYAAAPGEEPVFTSGVPIEGWRRPLRDPPGLPPRARGKVWIADVPATLGGRWRFTTLYEGGRRLPRARTAGFAPLDDGDDPSRNRSTLRFPPGALKNWPDLEDVEIFIRPYWNWTTDMLPLASVDVARGIAATAIPGTYALGPLHHERDASRSCWVENVMEGLDEPGNWVLNTREGRLTLWPRAGAPTGVTAPRLRQLLLVEGDPGGGAVVRNLVFEGLAFTQGDGYRWGKGDAGLQHDWEKYDGDDALVRLRGAEDCAVERCRFSDSGGTAVRLDLRCQRDRVCDNLIERMGAAGIVLCGYGPGRKDLNGHNEISDNLIRDCGEIYWHAAGILLFQSGENRVAHNLICHMPYTGIVLTGATAEYFGNADNREISRTIRWADVGPPGKYTYAQILPFIHTRGNVVEYNEIHHVMERLGDGNGIYIRMAGEGNVIRRNYVHDLVGGSLQTAIRTDGEQHGTLIAENVITRCVGGGITQKLDNRVENNLICDLLEPDDPRNPTHNAQRGFILLREGPVAGAAFTHNVLYQPNGEIPFYDAAVGGRKGGGPPVLKDAEVDYNLYYCGGSPGAGARFLERARKQGMDRHSRAGDPLFVDWRHDDFRLKPGSPLLKTGFIPIDMSRMGLTAEFPSRWRPDAGGRAAGS